MKTAFGVDHEEIAKADPPASVKGYRKSVFEPINPRSKTFVKEGSGLRRVARVQGGGLAGGFGGAAVGGALGAVAGKGDPLAIRAGAQAGQSLGGAAGASVGFHHNIKSGDVKSFQRSTGRQAKSKVAVPSVGPINIYGKNKVAKMDNPFGAIEKAAAWAVNGAKNPLQNIQASTQLQRVKETKGQVPKYKKLQMAKKAAGEKFQNK
jgi:hypothetical protein